VLIFHFPHLARVAADNLGQAEPPPLPYASVLYPVYHHGWMAVDLFFCISGFIFFALYRQNVADHRVTAKSFFIRRFCRLYPLHLLTLLIVALSQAIYHAVNGRFFIYPRNDLHHFLLNLFLLNGTPLAHGESFNGPSWSLSVEMLLYVCFFLLASRRLLTIPVVLAAVATGALLYMWDAALGRGLMSFYMGGLVFMLSQWRMPTTSSARYALLGMTLIGWILTMVEVFDGPGFALAHGLAARAFPSALGAVDHYYPLMGATACRLVLFPMTLFCVLSLEHDWQWLWRKLEWLGDISYSTYLVHIPVQIVMALLWLRWGDPHYLGSAFGMFVFLAVTLAVGLASFRFFEKPAQRWCRNLLEQQREFPTAL
jgi:peptidoglycan/LPS O-acetylase OafA/YrhL